MPRADERRSAAPPRLVYDDDCGFCAWSAALADRYGTFELVGFGELTPDQRARLPDGYESCVHLLTDDAVYSCGEATEQTLVRMGVAVRLLVSALRRVPGYPKAREAAYRWLADRRAIWGRFLGRKSA
ncbi:DCC1-like thiol-disulfide oxidoreductase family protein [Halegenticoccus tardaugens]|uniref:DCC1-like thiol-disulfide oxidoreductase family protein n=1 Tax=Halegenticoccus tardaugens TaxID=2071624 RepID=UPI00100BC8B5|nr:DCC1-like thiol-disulfide oxidoreductase family protein [Halegenticoccus tardaugens]